MAEELAFLVASTTALISLNTKLKSCSMRAPMLITISTSNAPLVTTSEASKAFDSVVEAPKGNPMTAATLTEWSVDN